MDVLVPLLFDPGRYIHFEMEEICTGVFQKEDMWLDLNKCENVLLWRFIRRWAPKEYDLLYEKGGGENN